MKLRDRKPTYTVREQELDNDSVTKQEESPLDNRYQCDLCKCEIEGYRTFIFHLKLAHNHHYINKLIQEHCLQSSNQVSPFVCPDCGKTLKTPRHYEMHLGTVHKKDFLSLLKAKVLPVVGDPNNYCQACDATYSNKNNYKAHLRNVHKISIFNPNAYTVPDPDDPNFDCKTCQKKYENRKKYRKHLYSIHNMRVVVNKPNEDSLIVKPEQEDPSSMPKQTKEAEELHSETYDASTTLKSKHNGLNSIMRKRNINLESELTSTGVSKQKKKLQPKLDDPNYYCRVCKKKYANKYGYRIHLRHIHNINPPQHTIRQKSKSPTELLPDPHDPDFHCRICKTTQFNPTDHRHHCRTVHSMVFERRYKNPDAVIDIDCPDLYCPKCEKYFKGTYYYRSHLKSVHEIIYKQSKKRIKSDVEIDLDSPDFHCAKCDKKFSQKYYYRRHLSFMHDLQYKSAKLAEKPKRRRVTFAETIEDA